VENLSSSGQWVLFLIDIDVRESYLANPVFCFKWVDFVVSALGEVNPAFGRISDDYRGTGNTSLELALNRPLPRSLREARAATLG
jgi:hypothetical protein